MSIEDFIREVGGGLAGVVIVVQGWANWIQYRRNSDLQDKLLSLAEGMVKESRELLTETNTTTSANAEVMRRAVQLLEEQRGALQRREGRQ